MSFPFPINKVFDPVKTWQNHRKLHTALPRERSAITKKAASFEIPPCHVLRLFLSILDAEVLLEIFVGSENSYCIAFHEDEVSREFQDRIAVSSDGKDIKVELVPDADLGKALTDPGFGYFDFEDRIITGIIKIVNYVCRAVTDS